MEIQIKAFGHSSKTLNKQEAQKLAVVCGCMDLLIHEQVTGFLQGYEGKPVLQQLSQDTTKVLRRQYLKTGLKVSKRSGKVASDFLVQCFFVCLMRRVNFKKGLRLRGQCKFYMERPVLHWLHVLCSNHAWIYGVREMNGSVFDKW
eukprot:762072-Amphidinium_carterae.3